MDTPNIFQSNVAALPTPAALFPPLLDLSVAPIPLPQLPQSSPLAHPKTKRPINRLSGKQPHPALPSTVPIGPYLARSLQERWSSYREQLELCQAHFSEHAVHELRVATRRLISQFILLDCLLPNASLEKARRVLKRRLVALGDLRDTQVERLFIGKHVARFPALLYLDRWLARHERQLVKATARKVERFRTRKLEKWIFGLAADLNAGASHPRTQKQLAAAVLQATQAAFTAAADRRHAITPADRRTIHQTRVAFKRFRYMVESLSPGITGLSRRQLRALAYYQRKMGLIQDLEVIQSCLGDFAREHKKTAPLLHPFTLFLRQRRARALRSFLQTADRLFFFWPPAALVAASTRVAHKSLVS
jgi:CHAD domain-containing protein